jgi:hypothetical protein
MSAKSLLAAAPLGLVMLACARAPLRPSAPSSKLGHSIAFPLPSDTGALVTIPPPGAHATVLDFFSPTCTPCKEKLPKLLAERGAIEAKGARLLLIGVLADSESTDDARRALESWGAHSPFLVDRGSVSRSEAGVEKLPATIVLDLSGVLLWVAPADATEKDVVAAVPSRE